MPIKTILVCLTNAEHADNLMKLAVPLAREHNAHLIGLHTIEALIVYPGIAMHVPGPAFAQFNESQRTQAKEIEDIFKKHTRNEDFISEWRLLKTQSTCAADRMVECARAADIVIMSREDRNWDRADQSHAQDRVIRDGGRPVIVVPHEYEGGAIGKSILLGWSETRESTRAAHDVIAVAAPDASVGIMRVGSKGDDELGDANANALAEHLDRWQMKATVIHRAKDGHSVAEMLNREAFETGADLVAVGAFGHSRTYDFVIGAATYDLLRNANLPVMFSK